MESMDKNKRFGMIAVEKGFIDKSQVLAAMEVQFNENMDEGFHRKIGAILFDQGLLNAGQVQEVLASISSTAKLAT